MTETRPPAEANDADQERLERTIALVQELFEAPTVTSARFLPTEQPTSAHRVHLTYSQKSLSAQSKRSLTQTLVVAKDCTPASPIVETAPEVKHVAFAPNGEWQAVFRVVPATKDKPERRVVELVRVQDGTRVAELDVTKKHGDWYLDATFGPPAWHADSSALVYTAEAPGPEPPSDSPSGSATPAATTAAAAAAARRPFAKKFDYTPDFGETFIGKKEPTLFLLVLPSSVSSDDDARTAELSVHRLTDLTTSTKGTVFGQPAFLPTSTSRGVGYSVVATAYSPTDDGRKLGIVYCQNRRARICLLQIEPIKEADATTSAAGTRPGFKTVEVVPISPADRSARSPRVVPSLAAAGGAAGQGAQAQEHQVVYVSNTLGGVHASCAKLQIATLSNLNGASSLSVTDDRTLVPVVYTPTDLNGVHDFPGLYVDQLPAEPFLGRGGNKIALTSVWRSRRVPLVIDLESGEIENLAPWSRAVDADADATTADLWALASYSVLGTDGQGSVLATRSTPGSPPQVVVCDLLEKDKPWSVLRKPTFSPKLTRMLDKIEFTLLPLPKHEPTELILVSPTPLTRTSSLPLPPLLVQPHGGPHSAAVTEFSYSRAAAVLHGYRFVEVNYPGSTGFGQQTIDDLPPLLGTLEVEATLAAGRYLRDELRLAADGRNKPLLMGGSHGGWTACHLTARWPDEYGAVVMRNPVTDLVANASMTDIPDWCYEEAAIPYPLEGPPSLVSPEEYRRMYDISPLRHAHRVTTPTLLLIGLEDRRVPPNQGRAWYHALKKPSEGRGPVNVEMMTFPGNSHPIAETVEAEWVAWESGLRWLSRYTDFAT
ncbi:hypothetical protein JCM3774_006521 [Rhodotorula dairenensis]